ncbi:MAG: stage II sporulation protein M, partial [Caldilineaceae bacterium]
MNPTQFIEQRKSQWQELETLQARARSTLGSLAPAEIESLGRLYRHATADLALAQRAFPRHRVTIYLNQLVGRTHTAIYREPPLTWRALAEFYRGGFPRLYRALLPWTSLAFLLFAVAALAAFFLVLQEPERLVLLQGEGIRPLMEQVEQGDLWTDIAPTARSAAAGLILTNNIRVMFLTFAGGMTAGLLTLWVMISNGLGLGGVFGLLQAHGLAGGLADFVVAHGFIELGVIFLAGGCGLALGDALLRPGLLSRRDALIARAQMGVKVILGCVPLLILAGLIEGFVSPSGLPFWFKLGVGLATGIALHG